MIPRGGLDRVIIGRLKRSAVQGSGCFRPMAARCQAGGSAMAALPDPRPQKRPPADGLDLPAHPRQDIFMTAYIPPPIALPSRLPEQVSFDRLELSAILSLYGRMVAAGEWRDYGISCLSEVAVFSIFRRTAENPLYRIEKRPKMRSKQGLYALIGAQGQVLRRGHDLAGVLRVLERKLIRAI